MSKSLGEKNKRREFYIHKMKHVAIAVKIITGAENQNDWCSSPSNGQRSMSFAAKYSLFKNQYWVFQATRKIIFGNHFFFLSERTQDSKNTLLNA